MKIFLMCILLNFSALFGVDYLLQQQQNAKKQIGLGILTDNWIPYIYGFSQMQVYDVGNPLINYILSNSGPVPTNGVLLYTDGMIGLPTYPLVSKFSLLVSPSLYNSTLPANEAILIKNQNLFGTIQSAINYAVNFANDNTLNRWTILVAPGTYLENLTIGGLTYATGADIAISISLAALGKVTVGDGTSTGAVACNMTRNNLAGGGRYQSIMFTSYRTNDINYNARWIITKGFTFNRADTGNPHGALSTVLMQLQYTTINGAVDLSLVNGTSGSTGCFFDLFECVFGSTFKGGTGGILMDAQGCVFNGLLTVNQYHNINGCNLANGMTCPGSVYNSTSEGIFGIYRSTLLGTFTATQIYIDHFTNSFSSTATYVGTKIIMQ